MPSVSIDRVCPAAAFAIARSAAASSAASASRCVQLGEHLGAALAADLDDEAVAAVLEHLGEREVVAGGRLRPGVHRDAEAGGGGLAAVDGDDERALAAALVVLVDVAALHEHAVLHRDRVQVAGAHADERVARGRGGVLGRRRGRRRRRGARSRPAARRGTGSSSTSSARRCGRTARRRRGARAGRCRPPARRSSRPAGRRSSRARRARSRGRAPSGRRACSRAARARRTARRAPLDRWRPACLRTLPGASPGRKRGLPAGACGEPRTRTRSAARCRAAASRHSFEPCGRFAVHIRVGSSWPCSRSPTRPTSACARSREGNVSARARPTRSSVLRVERHLDLDWEDAAQGVVIGQQRARRRRQRRSTSGATGPC